MLFEILFFIFAATYPLALWLAYRLGGGARRTPAPKPRGRAAVTRDRYDAILENINCYSGDGTNQREVR